ncbi:DUF2203 domain-containing protein [Thermomicrobium roseum]|jgi:hypothetical protein|uniref:DUF2203 family protein n=1 Tax=Thermomicrobium roseum (strain ATCC 27502 / DSM 5159 / P-2) TaxID=309801 RepID=B9L549_THERP|nr:DUF2203 domain-containing protein [Thermomicrobium roseum]ACM06476.1 conserved hypothetical protein [Thermomicrobium roseum DSM 5159]
MERKERRYFTVEEARALVPRLRGLLIALQAEKRELDQLLGELRRLAPLAFLNGHGAQLERIEQRVAELTRSIREKVRVIHQLGVEVKDLDMGIVDFPSLRDGREVYLCWRVDEPTVAYWHDLDAGFRGRQPLEE